MPTEDEVKRQIASLKDAHIFGTRKEIRHLPAILQEGEEIRALTSGVLTGGGTWLIVCTNRRLIFLDKGMLYGLRQVDTPLEKVNSIEQQTGFLTGQISVWDGASKMTIDAVDKRSLATFVAAVNAALAEVRAGRAPAAAPQRSVADELRKLADLRTEGILTDEEFQAQKKRLLAE